MATNKGHAALSAYSEEIQRVVSCVTSEIFYCISTERNRLNFSVDGGFFRVTCEDNSYLHIDINQEIEDPQIVGSVTTKYYLYSIADSESKDLIGFHFHPDLTEDPILFPHIHAYANKDERYLPLNLHERFLEIRSWA